MRTIYAVIVHWASEKDQDVGVSLFEDFDRANEYFHQFIQDEKEVKNEWDSDLFDENGNLIEEEAGGITLDIQEVTKENISILHNGYWKISDEYGNFTFITLEPKTVA